MEFMRLLFCHPVEEEVAVRWATRLAVLVGPAAMALRPQSTLTEMMRWAVASGVDSFDFAMVFEPELRMDLAEFLEQSDHVTFREMVEHYAQRFSC